ncbi:arginase [Alphaproteobacteria bacterium KMM 3653]|uniref:Arginase n=1 Tax=Harenicola maris TaxID=2841044 RepID=A0AAP2G4I8_9RHOB|nr:arginase [Harenicola maris]
MTPQNCTLIGAPVQEGTHQPGCLMGPDAFRTAGLAQELTSLGHSVTDRGNVAPRALPPQTHENQAIHHLTETRAWAEALQEAAYTAAQSGDLPIFLGGDHSLSIGTVAGVARHAADLDQPQFVLWLDAHPDMHTLGTTSSGNLHGTPLAYAMGVEGFEGHYPANEHPVDPANVCLIGIRSVDPAERALIANLPVQVADMRGIDETGIAAPLREFLAKVEAAKGRLHVSLDVDFLDPGIASAVGTTVPGGATFREAHLVMEMLHESGLMTSLDLVELNPFLDERGKTARLMVDLCGSLMGRRVLDKPTRSH